MARSITIVSDGKPIAWQRAAPVMVGSSPIMKLPAATRSFQKLLQQLAVLQNPGMRALEGPLEFYVLATLRRPAIAEKEGRAYPWKQGTGDADNYSKTAQDALNGLAFHDDAQICDLISRKRYGRPSLMIRITELEEPKIEPVGDVVQLTIAQMTEGKT